MGTGLEASPVDPTSMPDNLYTSCKTPNTEQRQMTQESDSLTVLSTRGVAAVKTYKRGEGGKVDVEGYGRAKRFTARTIKVDERGRWLRELRGESESFVVMGRVKSGMTGIIRRLSVDRDGQEATIEDAKRSWMPVDVDQIDFEPVAAIDDGETFALELMDRLGVQGVRCVWHLTNSHGFFGKYRIRLWLQLDEPATCETMKEWATSRWGDEKVEVDGKQKALVDMAVYRPAQPIYVGDPILEGVESPVDKRVGFLDGDALKMRIVRKKERQKEGPPGDEQNIELLREHGLYIDRLKPGQHMIRCPWEEVHTGGERDDDTFYFEPHHNGHDIPAFKCHHGSCEGKRWADVLDFMDEDGEPGERGDEEEHAPNWVYVHRLKSFWDARDGALIERESYDSTHGGKTKRGTPTDRFLAHPRSMKADVVEFLPGKPRFVDRGRVRVLNTYVEQRLRANDADDSKWVEHLEWLVPDREERDQLCDWLAWAYQHPGDKITWAPIMYGPPGTGKTSVFNCLAACLGHSYVSEPTQAELEDKFNDWCHDKLLVKIEELMSGDKYHVAEKLKPIVANPTISVRMMHKTGFVVANVCNVCASTNHMQALPIEKGDRRYMLISCCEAIEKERVSHMREFHRWLGQTGHGGIARWLGERDTSLFVPTSEAPMTRLKKVVQEASMTDLDRAIELCDAFDRSDVISSAMVQDYLLNNGITLTAHRVGLIAAKRRWLQVEGQERVRVGGRRLSFWTHRGGMVKLRAFLSKKPEERERAHDNVAARMTFGAGEGEKDDDVL